VTSAYIQSFFLAAPERGTITVDLRHVIAVIEGRRPGCQIRLTTGETYSIGNSFDTVVALWRAAERQQEETRT